MLKCLALILCRNCTWNDKENVDKIWNTLCSQNKCDIFLLCIFIFLIRMKYMIVCACVRRVLSVELRVSEIWSKEKTIESSIELQKPLYLGLVALSFIEIAGIWFEVSKEWAQKQHFLITHTKIWRLLCFLAM